MAGTPSRVSLDGRYDRCFGICGPIRLVGNDPDREEHPTTDSPAHGPPLSKLDLLSAQSSPHRLSRRSSNRGLSICSQWIGGEPLNLTRTHVPGNECGTGKQHRVARGVEPEDNRIPSVLGEDGCSEVCQANLRDC